ncbi:hypothetical protein NQ317_003828 [Molorchus minor]|uniref:Uncharacterized protein n=1 Tax=Molorchus minor TaxID=1323400 RepID=A0ABQ9JEF5_9CUCU|nr:hypothetical protein NQ317_003828 [Molorchus minor]
MLIRKRFVVKLAMKSLGTRKPKTSDDINLNFELEILRKEVECLQRERDVLNKYVAELEYSSNLLKANFNENQQKTTSPFLLQDKAAINSYSAALKKSVNNSSAVLLVKTTDQNVSNIQVEKDVKSKVNPGSLNANVLSTKLVKDGLLINCSDVESLKKTQNLSK